MSNSNSRDFSQQRATIGANSKPTENSKHIVHKNRRYSFKSNFVADSNDKYFVNSSKNLYRRFCPQKKIKRR